MMRDLQYIVLGYLWGSILFAKVFGMLLKKKDITQETADHNPGTYNAFHNGGFWCGVLTLCADLLKGFLPVHFYLKGDVTTALALVIAAPVIGHVFSLFHHFAGGKGVATTFGCLLGLLPEYRPVGLLVLAFLFFSIVVRIFPHSFRTLVAYGCAEIAMLLFLKNTSILIGFTLILLSVSFRMVTSKEEKKPFEVEILWMR